VGIRTTRRGPRRRIGKRSVQRARPFVVQVAALRKQAGATRHELRRGAIDGLAASGVWCRMEPRSTVDLTLSSYPGGITATAR
jgi:hypothetical protein